MSEPGGGKVFHSKMASKVPKVSRKRVVMEQVPQFLVLALMSDCFLFLPFFLFRHLSISLLLTVPPFLPPPLPFFLPWTFQSILCSLSYPSLLSQDWYYLLLITQTVTRVVEEVSVKCWVLLKMKFIDIFIITAIIYLEGTVDLPLLRFL